MPKSKTKESFLEKVRKASVEKYFKDFVETHRRVPRWTDFENDKSAPSYDVVCAVYGSPDGKGHHRLGKKTFPDVLSEVLDLPSVAECAATYFDERKMVHFRARDVYDTCGVYTPAQYGQWLGKLADAGGPVYGYEITRRSPPVGRESRLYTATLVDESALIDGQSVQDRIHALNLVNSSASPESALRHLLEKAGDSVTFCASDMVDHIDGSRPNLSKASRYGRYLGRRVGDVVDGYMITCTRIHSNRVYTATKVQPWHDTAEYAGFDEADMVRDRRNEEKRDRYATAKAWADTHGGVWPGKLSPVDCDVVDCEGVE